MKKAEIEIIKQILQERSQEFLFSNYLILRSYKEVISILNMPEWEDPKYQNLLTSSIWLSTYEKIKRILAMPEWNNPKYSHLLKPSMLPVKINKIREIIALFEELGLSDYLTNNIFLKSIKQIKVIYDYLIENGIPVIINDKLNPLFNYSKAEMLKRYGINLDELMNRDGVNR